jgi:hypothetical protein
MTLLVILAVWRFLIGDELPDDGAAAEGNRSDAPSSLGALPS